MENGSPVPDRIICTICVRAGSKGVRGKNIRPLGGKPLLAYSIETALASGMFAAVAVSSDSEEFLGVALRHGATHVVRRPTELASDEAGKIPAIRHALSSVESMLGSKCDISVDLDATSPLRTVDDLRGAISMLDDPSAGIVITGTPARRSPYFNLVERAPDGSVRLAKTPEHAILRRQDAPRCYDMNASIYVWRRHRLFEAETLFGPDTRLFEMPEERSVDIDSELDFEWVEWLMSRQSRGAHVP
jgi:CMP-N,N'-diacetyllegionaminic acid synthase